MRQLILKRNIYQITEIFCTKVLATYVSPGMENFGKREECQYHAMRIK